MNGKVSLIFIAISCLISGCVSNKPQDLRASKIGLIPKNQLREVVGDSIHESWVESDFIVVGLSTKTDLVEYVEKKGYPLNYDGWFCNQQEVPLFNFGLYSEEISIYTQPITLARVELKYISTQQDENEAVYYVIIPLSFKKTIEIYGRPERENAVFYGKYNLAASSSDICFRVGGVIYGFGFESNVATLPADIIQATINQ